MTSHGQCPPNTARAYKPCLRPVQSLVVTTCFARARLGTTSRSLLFSTGNKRFVVPNLNFVNVPDLNRMLRFEVFTSEDRQLGVVHLILDFKPLSDKFQDMGNVIRVGDPRLARIDVSVLGFLA
ncbi:hypothetical protein SO802_002164 [Lithocarpus litseifolius]|uniref:Uncharacterized protein n=1 Tax=Lithocarpus litseifolius TaxID=425828 RepID=A0AAW2E0H7_9ROSI